MTPLDAAMKEIALELEALRSRIGNGPLPESITVRVEFDRSTGWPRAVDCHEERKRRILGPGGSSPSRAMVQ